MQGVVDILPERATFRDNLALYSNYGSDFAKGEEEAREVLKRAPKDAVRLVCARVRADGAGPDRSRDRVVHEHGAACPAIGATLSAVRPGEHRRV